MKIAILGASGLVGRTMLGLLDRASWVDEDPVLLTSARSAGTRLSFRGRELVCQEVQEGSFNGVSLALFSAGGSVSLRWGPVAARAGCLVVDNSSAFRMDPQVPLVVPEINGTSLEALSGGTGGIIANPNCSTIQIAMALAPLEEVFGLAEVQVTTLQAVSGAGQAAVAELVRQQGDMAAAGPSAMFPRAMAGNVIPAIGLPAEDGFFEEEAKVERELRKILGRGGDLAVTCTATRVPVINGHSAAVRAVCSSPLTLDQARKALSGRPGLQHADDPLDYMTPLEMSGRTEVHVGRLRMDPFCDRALLLWVVADNLLKGAAWNAVQIAECFVQADGRAAP